MRIILDTNIWISYLLARDEQNLIRRLTQACIGVDRTLIVPPELITELRGSTTKYPYLGKRIPQHEVEALIQEFQEIAQIPPFLRENFPQYSRDAQDDYLLAHGIIQQVDYLVTGDKDLLVLGSVEEIQVVTPARMKNILEQHGWWE
jgi:putative PIN family toxin of toxin-antitoxin system